MSERALILSADKWSMVDERTGEMNHGVSVFYVNEYRADSDDSFGLKPTRISATVEVLDELKGKLPGHFDLQFGSRPGAQGRAALTLVGLKYVGAADLFAIAKKQSVV